jgi:transposase-like protein
MKRILPSVQMREALSADLQAGFAGQPLRQFVRRAEEYLLQVGVEDVVTAVLGRGHNERAGGPGTSYRNGYSHHTVKTEAGIGDIPLGSVSSVLLSL